MVFTPEARLTLVLLSSDGNWKIAEYPYYLDAHGKEKSATTLSSTNSISDGCYASPEQLDHKPVTNKADMWAIGCLFYEVITGKKAFPNAPAVFAYRNGSPIQLSDISCAPLRNLIAELLDTNAPARPDAKTVHRKLTEMNSTVSPSNATSVEVKCGIVDRQQPETQPTRPPGKLKSIFRRILLARRLFRRGGSVHED
jgi:serine/threonine protein kinase